MWVQSLGREDPLEMATHSRILAWKNPMSRGAWWTTSQWGCKEQDMTDHKHTLTLSELTVEQ